MTADAYDLEHEGESVQEIVKRKMMPLIEKIESMEDRFDDSLILDAKVVRYWLGRPVADWDWFMPGIESSMILECRRNRDTGYNSKWN